MEWEIIHGRFRALSKPVQNNIVQFTLMTKDDDPITVIFVIRCLQFAAHEIHWSMFKLKIHYCFSFHLDRDVCNLIMGHTESFFEVMKSLIWLWSNWFQVILLLWWWVWNLLQQKNLPFICMQCNQNAVLIRWWPYMTYKIKEFWMFIASLEKAAVMQKWMPLNYDIRPLKASPTPSSLRRWSVWVFLETW